MTDFKRTKENSRVVFDMETRGTRITALGDTHFGMLNERGNYEIRPGNGEKVIVIDGGDYLHSPTELGTAVHKLLSEHQASEPINGQLIAYASGCDALGGVMVLASGDLAGDAPGPDMMWIDKEGKCMLVDYKLTREIDWSGLEERVMSHIASDEQLARAVKQCTVEPEAPKIKPTREPKKRDWEQRNRKQRR